MPWWIWLILALFMIGMIVAGGIYAFIHGMRALQDVSEIGGRVSDLVNALGNTEEVQETTDPRPLYTQPITVAQERYRNAHADVISRKESKRDRHATIVAEWTTRNE